jgi:hypothetical protein
MRRTLLGLVLVAVSVTSTAGCAAVGLAVLGTGLGVAAGTGTAYTLDGIAYRTFTASVDDMRSATLRTFNRMDITVKSETPSTTGREIVGSAGDRDVYIELQKLTPRTTRMRVTAKQGWFFRDRSTAGEIIAQTEQALDDAPALTQKSR